MGASGLSLGGSDVLPRPAVGPDLRLSLVAGVWWLTTAALLAERAQLCLAVGTAAGMVAAGVAVGRTFVTRSGRTDGSVRRRRRARGAGAGGGPTRDAALRTVCAVFVGVGGAALVLAPHCWVRDNGPLSQAADSRQLVRADLVVRDDPRAVRGSFGPDRVAFVATLRAVGQDSGAMLPARGRVEVLAPADGWRDLLPGQRVSGSFRATESTRGGLQAAQLTTRAHPSTVDGPSAVQAAAGELRAGLRDAASGLPPDAAGLLPGLVVGDTSRLPDGVREDFRVAGLTHLTAVSGTNCAIVTGAVLVVVRGLGVRRRAALVCAGLALAGFVVLVRPSPSVLRAAALGWLALALLYVSRPRSSVPALAAVVVVLLVVDPALSTSAGFVLSVVATGAIVTLAARWTRRWSTHLAQHRGWPPRTALVASAALAVPLAAQVACWPVIAAMGGGVSLVAVPANVLVEPAVAPATIAGVVSAVLSPVWEDGARIAAWLAQWPVRWIVLVAGRAADAPAAQIAVPGGLPGLVMTVVGIAAVARVLLRPHGRTVAASAALATAVTLLSPVTSRLSGWPPAQWVVVACDVGQGDATVVRAGPGRAVVVDAGGDPGAVDRCLTALGVREVPVLVLSHGHRDHVGGTAGVVGARRVDTVLVSQQPDAVPPDVADLLADSGATVVTARAGRTWTTGDVSLSVLGPRATYSGTRSDANNGSLVVLARVGDVTVLLPGDVEEDAQADLLERRAVPDVDVLKVPHHGSAYQDPGFLALTRPSVALVGVGARNAYGHPATSSLDVLRRVGAIVARTDTCGDIAVATSRTQEREAPGTGRSLTVSARNCRPVPP